jgi:drug/metabolite transporter (DMT)-like permease
VPSHAPAWLRWAPALFVVLWSSGFVSIRLGVPHAEPFSYLAWRYALASALLFAVFVATRAPWPSSPRLALHSAVAGLLVHGAYLAGCFCAVRLGMPTAMVALIAGLQPVLTAMTSGPLLGERLSKVQWIGIALGFTGVTLVVSSRWTGPGALTGAAVVWGVVALLGITFGTLYQKRFCGNVPLLASGVIQYVASGVPTVLLAYWLESFTIDWTPQFVFALLWHVVVLSVGAIGLLFMLIRHGEASRVASLFFLTPPTTAVMAFLLFDERLAPLALAGLAASAVGVALVTGGVRMLRK